MKQSIISFITFSLSMWSSNRTPPAKAVTLQANVRACLGSLRIVGRKNARKNAKYNLLAKFAVIRSMPLTIPKDRIVIRHCVSKY